MLINLMLTAILATQALPEENQKMHPTQIEASHLYKVLTKAAWKESQEKNTLVLTSMDQEFIHLSTEEQIPRITEKYFKGSEYVILKIDPKKLKGRLVYESNLGGTNKYYHLYDGSIPMDSIVDVKL